MKFKPHENYNLYGIFILSVYISTSVIMTSAGCVLILGGITVIVQEDTSLVIVTSHRGEQVGVSVKLVVV